MTALRYWWHITGAALAGAVSVIVVEVALIFTSELIFTTAGAVRGHRVIVAELVIGPYIASAGTDSGTSRITEAPRVPPEGDVSCMEAGHDSSDLVLAVGECRYRDAPWA